MQTQRISKLLLTRRGLVFLPEPDPRSSPGSANAIGAVLLELAKLGYAGSTKLRLALERLSTAQLGELRDWTTQALHEALGSNQIHTPLFRRFPQDVPEDTQALWFRRVLSHFFQAPDQPCLHCGAQGSTHVLRPCEHVVCDRCYDGANYSACPICNHKVDRSSPFFQPDEAREAPTERVRFKRLDLGEDLDAAARALFEALCARPQALNPDDEIALTTLVEEYGERIFDWLPAEIPLRENVAQIFGGALLRLPAERVLTVARPHLRTATDLLRLIAAASGADPALQGATICDKVETRYADTSWWQQLTPQQREAAKAHGERSFITTTNFRVVKRFPMAKLGRATRRALLGHLERFDGDTLIEDMLRHRSYWVWVGEFLHPGEYAKRFPKVARAFRVVRKRSPDGTPAAPFHGFYSQVERATAAADSHAMVELLRQRPGEYARRLDLLLRIAGDDPKARAEVLTNFTAAIRAYSTPLLLTLYALLPTRAQPAARRMFWPKGKLALGVTAPDERQPLHQASIVAAHEPVTSELLRRFAERPRFALGVVDDALAEIIAPFNERTASPAAINLPRGSRVAVPPGKLIRLFLHWCEPQRGRTTDIDLSVAFYDASWTYVGVCSYYQLSFDHQRRNIARSSGDFTSAPYPEGASEFVDLDREAARAAGIRYAVMVVNAYAGEPFSQLERGFAGLMLRDDPGGHHFDPRSVALRFNLQGENGIYMPLCVDLERDELHWLDVYARGQLAMNNVDSSNKKITTICPETIEYFASGVRLDMRRLALLHAAARCDCVVLRGPGGLRVYRRQADESAQAFLARLQADTAQPTPEAGHALTEAPALALLHRGDLELAEGSSVYALFSEQLSPTLAAADLL
ncbi:hypothetical protein G6O69_19180 [Pseudenhygromyxa sp. WMMC2535]|uniref:MXAN_6230/SCO0854 family RING domain-containing protein n=1 Tax=Pseudenhygromyxa sp. WMMC2535 TaxID=2712867 RepID=UPI001551EE35|nr:MXAN_6230/SCO0854 family RING domain-containing protein [Pseudenhygromyxa sp. WMMC2535]NVB39976.1 hypothetical protein [Pseudenhygromyxa sp. WMMC2535]